MNATARTISISTACAAFLVAVALPVYAFGIPTPVGGDQTPRVDEVQAPTAVRVTASTPRTMTVSWVSGYRTITNVDAAAGVEYDVDVYSKKTGDLLASVTTSDSTATVRELNANKGYVVRVQARKGRAESSGAEAIGRTRPKKPQPKSARVETGTVIRDVITNEPINPVQGSSAGKFQARLKWKKAPGKIRYYTVRVYRVGGESPLKTVTSKKRRVSISGLKKNTTYQYTVSAHFNDEYYSAESKRKKFTVKKKK